MSDLFLTQDEVRELTARIQYASQRKELNFMGIEHRVRSDGTLLVLRAHVEQALGLKLKGRQEPEFQPDWNFACEAKRNRCDGIPEGDT